MTIKCSKICTPCPSEKKIFFLKTVHQNANRVDSEQTALKEQSDPGLHCLPWHFCKINWCSNLNTVK